MNTSWFLVIALAFVGSFSHAEEPTVAAPPLPGEPREIKVPEPVEKMLTNGLRVIVVQRTGLPILSAQLVIKSGAEVDPSAAAGAMSMLATLLTRGAGDRSAPQLAQAIEALGATIETGAGWDMTSAKLTILSGQATEGLSLLSDVVRHPTLASTEIERLRAETLDELRVNMEQPGTVARAAAARLIYGAGPYGHLASGTPKSIEAITRPQLQKLHTTYFRPDHAVLIFVGNLTPAQGFAWAEEFFGDWKKPATPTPVLQPLPPAPKPRVVVVDMPNAGQAAVMVGKPAVSRQDGQYFPGLVASTILGGGYSARLNAEIRVKRGLTYGASSDLAARRQGGAFMAAAQTKNSAGPEVATLMRAELDRLAAEPVPADEMTPRTSTLIGEYGRALETNDGIATKLAGWAVQGISLDALQTYVKDVQAIAPGTVQKFAVEQLRSGDTSVVIAGHAGSMKDTLMKAFPNAEVIPQKTLDLDSATLRPPTKTAKKK